MRTYEIETDTGSQCFVIASNIDQAKALVTKHLGLSTKEYSRNNNSKIVQEPGVYTKVQSWEWEQLLTVSTNLDLRNQT